ncbi:glycosyltransferase family 2 protein [Oculatella sp. LEGE 06141]|nr:glycosyltransferase family 2 protein [Oculatella sp. LEGE 06141]
MSEQAHRATILPVPEGTNRPLWSVMIPTYNCAAYLRETLTSVLAQAPVAEEMQIEVVDDHSTQDDPEAVVTELGKGRVTFYRQPQNVGYIRNFETCLQRSRGQLIHLLHGDDVVRDGFYRTLQRGFEQHPDTGAAFCRHIYMDEHSHWESFSPLEQPTSGILANWLEKIAAGQRLATPAMVVRRDVYEQLGGFDRRFSRAGEDWEMWVRIATQYPVWFEVEPLALYRVKRSGSLTEDSAFTGQLVQEMRLATEIIDAYLPSYLPEPRATERLNLAREMYTRWSMDTMQQMIAAGQFNRAIAQAQEVLRHSPSPKTVRAVMSLFLWHSLRWSGRSLYTNALVSSIP